MIIPGIVMLASALYSSDDLDTLAEAVYFEARSEPVACQIMVAQNILNRVGQARFPDTIKGVIEQRKFRRGKWYCQYSYFCDGRAESKYDYRAEELSYQVASMVLNGDVIDLSEGSDHYYAHRKVQPSWAFLMYDVFICGDHTFGKLDW